MGFVALLIYYFIHFNVIISARIEYNTYENIVTRATTYVPRVVSKVCTLKPDPGPCRANIPMYYFDPASLTCSKFTWGGCQGNGNRFDHEKDCTESCLNKPNEKKKRPRWCSLTFDYGFCFGDVERWYYDRLWKICKKTLYSGCGGNKNNFYNKEQCDAVCRFSNGPIPGFSTTTEGLKKILIINPWDATAKRGREQETQPTTPSEAPCNATAAG